MCLLAVGWREPRNTHSHSPPARSTHGAANNVVVNINPHPDYPMANSQATRMLAEALDAAKETNGWSQLTIAKMLNYKTSVMLSHMALGRVAIPIDRSLEMAQLLGMERSKFLLAVLEQRHPGIDFAGALGVSSVLVSP